MAPSSTMVWSDNVHTDVLISIVDTLKISPPQWEEIIKATKDMGYTFSVSALRYDLSGSLTILSCVPIPTKYQKKQHNPASHSRKLDLFLGQVPSPATSIPNFPDYRTLPSYPSLELL